MSSSLLSRLAALHKVSAVSSDSNAITPGIDDAIAPNNELISDRFIDSKENENETTINSSEWFKPKSCNNSSNKQEEPSSASKNKESKGSFDTEVKLTTYATLVWAKLEGFKATGDKQLVSRFCGRICPQSWKTSNLKPDEELVEFFNLPRDFKMEHTECAVSRRFIRPFNAPFSNKITFATNPNAWSDYETEWDCASMDNLYKFLKHHYTKDDPSALFESIKAKAEEFLKHSTVPEQLTPIPPESSNSSEEVYEEMFENTDSMHSAAFDAVMARKGRTNHCTLDRTLHSGDWISQQNKVFPDLREYCQIQSVYWEGDRLMVKLPQYMQIPGRADDVCKLQPDPTPDSKGYLDESAGVHLTLMFGDYELIADDGEVRPAKTKTIAKKPQKTEQVNEQSKASLMSHLKPKIQPPISTNSSVSTVVQSGSSGNKKRKQIVCSQSQSDTQSQSQTQSQTLSLTSSTESKSSSNGTSSKAAKTSNSSRSSQSTAPSLISISSSRRGATSETMRNRLAGILLERQDMVMDEAGPDATITHLYKITWAEVEKTAAKIDFANLFSKDLDHAFYPVDEISQAFDQLFDVRLEPKDLNRTMNRTALIGALTVQFLAFYSGSL